LQRRFASDWPNWRALCNTLRRECCRFLGPYVFDLVLNIGGALTYQDQSIDTKELALPNLVTPSHLNLLFLLLELFENSTTGDSCPVI